MKTKILNFVKIWSKKKRSYAILLLVVLILFTVLKPKIDTSVLVDTVKEQDLESTVSSSGQVTSNTELSLSFNAGGMIRSMRAKVGDKVYKGEVLATVDSGNTLGALTSAKAALAGAQARYKKLVEGASGEEVDLANVALRNAEIDLENTKHQQNILVTNAKRTLLSSDLEAVFENGVSSSSNIPIILGTYTSGEEGSYKMKTYNTGAGLYFSFSGLENGGGPVTAGSRYPLGSRGLYIEFPVSFSSPGENNWIVNVPNKQSTNYLVNLNALNSALETEMKAIALAQSTLEERKAELALKTAAARSFELDLAQSEVLSAEGQVQSAQANYENTVVRAPAPGTVTQVNMKLGEQAEPHKEVIVLEDVDNLYVEADVNEANIIKIKNGQQVAFSIDSFGPEAVFNGEVIEVDPGATEVDGIVNYKIKVSILDGNKDIRPGMNADIKVMIASKPKVLVVPKLSLITHDGKTYVRVITDEKKKKYQEREVQTGMFGDGNLVEVMSGVSAGEKIAVISKTN